MKIEIKRKDFASYQSDGNCNVIWKNKKTEKQNSIINILENRKQIFNFIDRI